MQTICDAPVHTKHRCSRTQTWHMTSSSTKTHLFVCARNAFTGAGPQTTHVNKGTFEAICSPDIEWKYMRIIVSCLLCDSSGKKNNLIFSFLKICEQDLSPPAQKVYLHRDFGFHADVTAGCRRSRATSEKKKLWVKCSCLWHIFWPLDATSSNSLSFSFLFFHRKFTFPYWSNWGLEKHETLSLRVWRHHSGSQPLTLAACLYLIF